MNSSDSSSENRASQRNMMTSFIQIATLVILVSYSLMIVGPFAKMIAWGIILAVAIYPLHRKLAAAIGGREKLSATLIVAIGMIFLLLPGWFVTASSIDTAKSLTAQVQDGTFRIPPPPESVAEWPLIGERIYKVWSAGAGNLDAFLRLYKEQFKAVSEWLLVAAGSLVMGLLHFTVSIVIAGVCLSSARGGYELSRAIGLRITPARGEHLADLTIATIRSVTNGVLGVAMIQAGLAGIGFALIGVPAAGILCLVILVTAIIQIPAIAIMAPIIVWVFSFADLVPATIFAVYSVLVGLSDNVLKPLLLGRGVELPVLVVLLGAIGGMIKFGVIGLFIGAVILGLGYRIICDWIWPSEPVQAQGEEAALSA
jgi:predicted PurR-regulated permease PerM